MSDWRNTYFQKLNCEGMVEKTPSGDFLVQGRLKNHDADAKIMFWAAFLQVIELVLLDPDYPILIQK